LDILNAINSGIDKPTLIMSKCNISYRMFLMMMEHLTVQGLVKEEEKGKRVLYKLTDRGKQVHKYFSEMQNIPPVLIIPESYFNGGKRNEQEVNKG
jgi:predicted transcriptional regulator